ncbi:hypothetical protein DAPPUDRAFT_244725 [Daphnia pulex]|uniref:Uncharacterized protein n=1 Tax=Daphnia pulex TaxID=6669 RepID=E9GLN2_DAPPU|nr:hypothetical protein DAPPUDRAFT_244725 [Daphnia pulex]|eukprot:EFX79658.1 hypothetical protein DAPPUDRAFT_244725 [Daphnia pulex]
MDRKSETLFAEPVQSMKQVNNIVMQHAPLTESHANTLRFSLRDEPLLYT